MVDKIDIDKTADLIDKYRIESDGYNIDNCGKRPTYDENLEDILIRQTNTIKTLRELIKELDYYVTHNTKISAKAIENCIKEYRFWTK